MSRRVSPLVGLLLLAGACTQPTGPERAIEGKRLYGQYCARCHGDDGVPTPQAPTASSFAVPGNVERLSDEAIKGVIRKGRGQMPGFGERFTDATLQVLVAYVRSLPATAGAPAAPKQE